MGIRKKAKESKLNLEEIQEQYTAKLEKIKARHKEEIDKLKVTIQELQSRRT